MGWKPAAQWDQIPPEILDTLTTKTFSVDLSESLCNHSLVCEISVGDRATPTDEEPAEIEFLGSVTESYLRVVEADPRTPEEGGDRMIFMADNWLSESEAEFPFVYREAAFEIAGPYVTWRHEAGQLEWAAYFEIFGRTESGAPGFTPLTPDIYAEEDVVVLLGLGEVYAEGFFTFEVTAAERW